MSERLSYFGFISNRTESSLAVPRSRGYPKQITGKRSCFDGSVRFSGRFDNGLRR
ncbi:hypothetical protein RSSM_05742 [Rhodopirellula sallentina SM41]|uniref:Uncharacterized protein n=1 Tax=Rhodopirellula sallentina SM41 TaxID=1263870 RepID=M5TUI9_9BACT|nr:hypothetical protein RSSM_05742 [Rhodopirellula sallentina SM41]